MGMAPPRSARIRWIDWMLPGGLSDEEAIRRARMIAGLSLLALVMCLLSLVETSRVYGAAHLVSVTLVAMILLFAADIALLKRSRSLQLPAVAGILTLLVGELTMAAGLGGIQSPQLVLFGVVILFGGFLAGWRTGLLFAALTQTGLIVFYILEAGGHHAAMPVDPDPAR